MRAILILTLAPLAVAIAGCGEDAASGFVCKTDVACESGACIDGRCAKMDKGCDSGYRWDDSAGTRQSLCAVFPDMALPPPPDMTMLPPRDMTFIDPNCGNGKIDPGEQCDPGMGSPSLCPAADSDCDDGEPCTNDYVIGAACKRQCVHDYNNLGDGVKCPIPDGGTPGECRKHQCCTGCWNGADCIGGQGATVCGAAGVDCADCTANVGECLAAACAPQGCQKSAVVDGTQCAKQAGQCHGGACCTGCLMGAGDGGTCMMGTSNAACGAGGTACTDCMGLNCAVPDGGTGFRCVGCLPRCQGKQCGDDGCGGSCGKCPAGNFTCVANQCVCAGQVENNDALCSNGLDDDCNNKIDCADNGCAKKRCTNNGGSWCVNNACTKGCLITGVNGGMTFYADGAADPANPCFVCNSAKKDSDWTVLGDSTPCALLGTNGQCHRNTCCLGCWDANNSKCIGNANQSANACGVGGAACASCDDTNPCTVDGCAKGVCGHSNVPGGVGCAAGSACSMLCVGCPLGGSGCVTSGSACDGQGKCVAGVTGVVACCNGGGGCRNNNGNFACN